MAIFNATFDKETSILKVGFNPEEPATNAEMVVFLENELKGSPFTPEEGFCGGLLKITGACSLPLAFVISHKVDHLFGAIAVFDPKLGGYVVCVSHNPAYKVGDVIPQ